MTVVVVDDGSSCTNKLKQHEAILFNTHVLVCLAFNAASFQSVWEGGPRFSGVDPVLSSLALVTLWWVVYLSRNGKGHSILCLLAALIHAVMCVGHIQRRDIYIQEEGYHSAYWKSAAVMNAIGSAILVCRAVCRWKWKVTKAGTVAAALVSGVLTVLILLFVSIGLILGAAGAGKGSIPDASSVTPDTPFFATNAQSPKISLPFQYSSQYVTMSDGVDLAVDVYLPRNYDEINSTAGSGGGLPTILHLTRYHRAEKRSPWTKFIHIFGHPPNPGGAFPMRSLHYLKWLVPHGYAFVSVDVRGTGASFGTRPLDLMEREVQDFAEMAAWTHSQPFCNGRIGTGGISYDGITGALMAAQNGTEIQATVLLFAPGDIYEDIAFVGGIPTTGFIDGYGMFTTASENNEPVNDVDNDLPASFKMISQLGFQGVAPVTGAEDRLPEAIAQHRENFDMESKARDPTVISKDSTLVVTPQDGRRYSPQDMGISEKTYNGLFRNKVWVYSVAGYYDSGSVRSAARLHNHLVNSYQEKGEEIRSKLTIGPWTHGARAAWTPTKGAEATVSQYPLFEDVKRFFDCRLKDECAAQSNSNNDIKTSIPEPRHEGIDKEPILHYFLSGKDEWQSEASGKWPRTGLEEHVLKLDELSVQDNKAKLVIGDDNDKNVILYEVDFTATTGVVSRWNLVQHLMKKSVTYSDRLEQSSGSLVFHTSPVRDRLTIVGSAIITLSISLCGDATDAAVFVYLEEWNPAEKTVNYITEAALRLSHRASVISKSSRVVGAFDSVRRTFLNKDMKPLNSNEFTQIEFVMEPVAYVVEPGHELRVVLAGADKDNFYIENIPNNAKEWKLDLSKTKVTLPIKRDS